MVWHRSHVTDPVTSGVPLVHQSHGSVQACRTLDGGQGPHRHGMGITGSASAPTRPLPRAKTPRTPSPLELRLLVLIRASGFPEPEPEHPFAKHLGRRWRFDFAWPALMLAVEVDGGAWVPGGGRHTRGAGFAADHDKMNRAMLLGWRVLRFTARHLADGSALVDLAEALGSQPR